VSPEIQAAAYKLWVDLINGDKTEREALTALIELLAGLA
jgi:hypothetical protein